MKSFLIAAIISVLLFGSFMQLFDQRPKAWFNVLPSWLIIAFLVVSFAGYLGAAYLGFREVRHHHTLLNVIGICMSLFGIACFALMFSMSAGKGKERPGQFAHTLSQILPQQRAALDSLIQQSGVKPSQVEMVAYWKMFKNPAPFVICIQDSNVIGLQVKNKPLSDLQPVARLPKLSWLILDNCGLTSLEALRNPMLERLDVSNNKLVSLDGIEHSGGIGWLDFSNNPISDSSAWHPRRTSR